MFQKNVNWLFSQKKDFFLKFYFIVYLGEYVVSMTAQTLGLTVCLGVIIICQGFRPSVRLLKLFECSEFYLVVLTVYMVV